jgi:hypothetical protein
MVELSLFGVQPDWYLAALTLPHLQDKAKEFVRTALKKSCALACPNAADFGRSIRKSQTMAVDLQMYPATTCVSLSALLEPQLQHLSEAEPKDFPFRHRVRTPINVKVTGWNGWRGNPIIYLYGLLVSPSRPVNLSGCSSLGTTGKLCVLSLCYFCLLLLWSFLALMGLSDKGAIMRKTRKCGSYNSVSNLSKLVTLAESNWLSLLPTFLL